MRIVFHIDVNSAYLSWEAVYRLENGDPVDLRLIPSVVGGDPKTRRGIVLAKSIPAKAYRIQTGEALNKAYAKCPILTIVRPSYGLYMKCSNAMKSILEEYSGSVQRFSVDEFFVEFTDYSKLYGDPMTLAHCIKDRIRDELGFTVNVGISSNKLLAKVASDFQKPDQVHTLYPNEIQDKMWPLPVEDLFMVGRATGPKLNALGIYTIGELAKTDPELIRYRLKTPGIMVWEFANGIEDSALRGESFTTVKGIGNSTTIPFDVTSAEEAHMVLLSLTEMVSMRLREEALMAGLVSISIRSATLESLSHQQKLFNYTDHTPQIFEIVKRLFNAAWEQQPIRHLGVRVSLLAPKNFYQYSLFDQENFEKGRALDQVIDAIRNRYGNLSLQRACFIHSGLKSISGGVSEADYPMMASLL
jgi:DNA polymerase-4